MIIFYQHSRSACCMAGQQQRVPGVHQFPDNYPAQDEPRCIQEREGSQLGLLVVLANVLPGVGNHSHQRCTEERFGCRQVRCIGTILVLWYQRLPLHSGDHVVPARLPRYRSQSRTDSYRNHLARCPATDVE